MAIAEQNTRALAIIPRSLDEVTDLAEKLSKSTLLPKSMQGKMPDVLVTILAGQEMGLSPMASLRNFHVIEGKPVLSADGMVALVLGSGRALYFERVEESEMSVTYETMRVGSKSPRRCTWTMEMAKKAALHQKDNWRCYPRQMLASRAKKELAVDVYPDVLAGCYIEDEIEDPRPAREPEMSLRSNADVVDAEFMDAQPEDPPEVAAIDQMETVEALKAHAAKVSALGLTGILRQRATNRYNNRMGWLKRQPAKPAAATAPVAVVAAEQPAVAVTDQPAEPTEVA